MRYESAKTHRGNIGVSYVSQEEADAQAAAMDAGNCSYCSNCSRCSRCSDCSDCSNCSGCSRCSNCSGCSRCLNCSDCSNCSGCSYCSNCSGCSYCSYCSDCSDCSGVLLWRGGEASSLLAINGLRWPVATDGKMIQIGCQCHEVTRWARFSNAQISAMDPEALEFWENHKERVLDLAALKA